MRTIVLVLLLAACGGKAAPAADQPATPTGETAPGGVPGTPNQCCCELPESRGMQLSTEAECAGQQGTCKAAAECTATDEPSPMN
jgi:hypothetical protein